MAKVYRVYVEKRKENAVEADSIKHDLMTRLGLTDISNLTVVNRYDLQGITEEVLEEGIPTILSEPMVDEVYREEYAIPEGAVSFAIEYLPGQYDARADACEQCFQLLTGEKGVKVKCAKLIVIEGISSDELPAIKHYLINPVDSREASLEKPADLNDAVVEIKKVPVIEGFIGFTDEEVEALLEKMSLAMNFDDLKVTQNYFRDVEKRDPTETEIRVLDTYWSDHCRHNTFATVITDIDIASGAFKEILEKDVE